MSEKHCGNCRYCDIYEGGPCSNCEDADQWVIAPDDEIISLRALLTAATERAEKAESQRDRMREALGGVRIMLHTELKAYADEPWAQRILKEVGDE